MQKAYFYFQYLILRGLVFLVKGCSENVSGRIAETVGSLLFLRKRRRRISIENVHAAFPGKSAQAVLKIGRASMQGMVKVVFEFLRIPVIARNPEKHIEIRGEENVWDALKAGKGVILVVSHFGNWELMAVAAAARGIPIHAVGKPVKNPFIYDFIKRFRGATGLKSIDQKGAVGKMVQLLRKNKVVAVLIDEHAKKGEVWVDFLGRKAATSGLPAALSLKYDTPVISTFYFREEKTRSVLLFQKPFDLIKTGNFREDLAANTQQYAHCLEEQIQRRPEDWTLWMHNRWRLRTA